jgi:IS30 family transposase
VRIGGRPAIPVAVQREFWAAVRSGMVVAEAAEVVGVSITVAWRWFRHVGGVMPEPFRAGRPLVGAGRLSFREREEISCRRAAGEGVRTIARALGRSPSTISRELGRGTVRRKSGYRASVAQTLADQRARRPKERMLALDDKLRDHVQDRLDAKDSPEQISQRLKLLFPDDPAMRVSHETIYRSLYVQGRCGLRRELAKCLRTGRALRKTRRTTERRGRLAGVVSIAERPAEADDRAVPGHWEGDLITGKENKSAIGTLVERSTGYVMLLHLPDRHGAEAVRDEIARVITTLPEQLRRSLTWDQGAEMAQHVQLRIDTGLEIYFADPHSPWQRGTNENTVSM